MQSASFAQAPGAFADTVADADADAVAGADADDADEGLTALEAPAGELGAGVGDGLQAKQRASPARAAATGRTRMAALCSSTGRGCLELIARRGRPGVGHR